MTLIQLIAAYRQELREQGRVAADNMLVGFGVHKVIARAIAASFRQVH